MTRRGDGLGFQTGSMLIISLWLIMVLAAAAVALSGYLSTETRLMRYVVARAQARAWATTGMTLAMKRLADDVTTGTQTVDSYDWLGDDWAYVPQNATDPATWVVPLPLGQAVGEGQSVSVSAGQVSIQITDEERKVDINKALIGQLKGIGLSEEVASAIIDYHDADQGGSFENIPPLYQAKNSDIKALEELRELPGMTDAVYGTLQPYATVYTGGAININTADVEVLEALIDPANPDYANLINVVGTLVSHRPGNDGQLGTSDDCRITQLNPAVFEPAICSGGIDQVRLATLLSTPHLTTSSTIFRIVAIGTMQQPPVRARIDAIVKRNTTGSFTIEVGGVGFQILAWKER